MSRRLLSNASPLTLGVTAALGAGMVTYNISSRTASETVQFKPGFDCPSQRQKKLGPKPLFPASGFVDLVLEDARMVNHDTRELRFGLPGKEGEEKENGLGVVCMFPFFPLSYSF